MHAACRQLTTRIRDLVKTPSEPGLQGLCAVKGKRRSPLLDGPVAACGSIRGQQVKFRLAYVDVVEPGRADIVAGGAVVELQSPLKVPLNKASLADGLFDRQARHCARVGLDHPAGCRGPLEVHPELVLGRLDHGVAGGAFARSMKDGAFDGLG